MGPVSAFALLALALQSSAATVTRTLPIVNKVISPDGFKRSAVLAGGIHPGPLISAKKGDALSVTVSDQLTDGSMVKSTSLHWHGIAQKGTNWADGPAGVNQCPIAPGHSFTYNFKTYDQAGTYWYHSHHSTQYCDGLRGPIVIYDPNDPFKHMYDCDDENTILTLSDWYHTPAKQIAGIAYANSTLINGLGRYPGGPQSPLAVVKVVKGKRYRMRLISMACDPYFLFQIDGHTMTIIEADGVAHKPYTVDSITILAGQRYSFILTANQPVNNYWIRADPNNGAPGWTLNGFEGGRNSAILRYVGAPSVEPTTKQDTSKTPFDEANLVPYVPSRAPGLPKVGGADVNINLNITVDLTKGVFLINGRTFAPPTVPVLLQILSGTQTAQDLLPEGLVYPLPRSKTVEISMPGGSPGTPHPLHLHGHSFYVVRSAGQTTYNYENPPLRDVVSIGGAADNVTIRFRTDNPGPWFLHCHIDWHLAAGFAVVFAEDIPDTKEANPVPKAWKDLCPIYNALDPADQ